MAALAATLLAALALSSCDSSKSSVHPSAGGARFANGMNATVAIGQPDLVTGAAATTSTGLSSPGGVTFAGSKVLLVDSTNNRILGYNSVPAASGTAASFVLGQGGDFTTAASGTTDKTFNSPTAVFSDGIRLAVADGLNNRVLIWFSVPTTDTTPDRVLGQTLLTTAGATCNDGTAMNSPSDVAFAWPKLLVADTTNHRVLVWNDVSTAINGQAADVILGQALVNSCILNGNIGSRTASGLYFPQGVWTDGTRVAVADTNNNRVLIWNTWPTANGQAADVVAGETGMTAGTGSTTATGEYLPVSVTSHGTRLFVSESFNERVTIFNTFPTANGPTADTVLGQPDFTTLTAGLSASAMNGPAGLAFNGVVLLVADHVNNRVLVFP